MTLFGGGNFSSNLSILDGKNYDHRMIIIMEVILGYQKVIDTMKEDTREHADAATTEKKKLQGMLSSTSRCGSC